MYYGNNAYAPKAYRAWLSERIRPLIRAHGLERGREDPVTGGIRSTATPGAAPQEPPVAPGELPQLFGAPPDPAALF